VDSVCPNGPQAHACRERLAITFTVALRVEVDAHELRIIGSESELLRTFVAASSAKWRVLTCPVLYRNGAPRSTKMSNIASA
jgi:hypothetical protein